MEPFERRSTAAGRRATDIDFERELATHTNELLHVHRDIENLAKRMETIHRAVDSIQETVAELRGFWHMALIVGSGVVALATTVAWLIDHGALK